MPYHTHKTIATTLLSRFREMWDGVYKIGYENLPISPAPSDMENWLEFSIILGDVLGKRITIDGDYSVNRYFGIVRIKAHVPVGTHVATLMDITDLIGRTFSQRFWAIDHAHIFPATLRRSERVGNTYMGIIDVPFHFDQRAGDVDQTKLMPSVVTALTNANSPLLGLMD